MSVVRFGVSFEKKVLDALDEYVLENKFSNRSQALRQLVNKHIVEKKWLCNNWVAGTVTLVYDHHRHELSQKLVDVQHHDYRCIVSSLHIHLDEHNCLEVIVLKGKAKKIQRLADSLISTRGVIHGRFIGTTTGKELL